jgi:hypothetical protein
VIVGLFVGLAEGLLLKLGEAEKVWLIVGVTVGLKFGLGV